MRDYEWIQSDLSEPPVGEAVIGCASRWLDEDFNPRGVRECMRTDEGPWISATWNPAHDCYENSFGDPPDYWMRFPITPLTKNDESTTQTL